MIILLKFSSFITVVGICNPGHDCFFISAFQCLIAFEVICDALEKQLPENALMARELQKVLVAMNCATNNKAVNAQEAVNMLRILSPDFVPSKQIYEFDSGECVEFIVNQLVLELDLEEMLGSILVGF